MHLPRENDVVRSVRPEDGDGEGEEPVAEAIGSLSTVQYDVSGEFASD